MGLYNKLAEDISEVDIIIAGGGTAGCIIAGRLAEADPDLSILVIEGGADNKDVASIVHPVFYLQNLVPTSTTAIFYKGNKAKQLADREPIVPCGGTLGGGSSINFMMYTRAQRADFDSWKTPGWAADDMWPFLKKLETYHGPGDKEHHGHDGPIHVSEGGYCAKSAQDEFIRASGEVGIQEIEDLQNLENNDGVSRWQRYVSPDGKRQDTAHTYVHPKLEGDKYPNLHVLVESKVIRVLFDDNKRAVGVEYTPNAQFQAVIGLTQHPVRTVKARKLVVVTCGACGTPPVLERSGLGDKKILERAGVPLVEELPGVGKDYQDHHLVLYPYKTSLAPDQTIDAILSGRKDAAEMIKNNDKMLGWNSIDISSKIRPSEDEVTALGPDFRQAWDRDFKNVPNRPLMLCGIIQCYLGDPASVPVGQYVTAGTYTAYPYSRGHMHITGSSVNDPLDFDVGFFTDANDIDLKKQMWAYKKHREILRRADYFRGELAAGHPKFAANSKAAIIETDVALTDVKNLEYTKEDDEVIEQFLRESVNTTWHSLGTCKMAPREQDGVVDAELNVYGVKGLKIADLSIAPENVAANTNNTALVIGEKAADIILSELGLNKGKSPYPNGQLN
ncbi:GMC oxidoreductase [Dothidotthia symphoricarpi CBS 119687]|uniref:GMC oxidoreductase n=1 Tax=Dothidotthia symphoricarpi CBS 119687 TaxID=1392245 RepID=A0A6A6AW13_9PLEO|nr:GMC oxidoreductase [Dothidotthia symphoricarpi CBS 119687]KAF2134721.1 GMC oxidoreductase [Dothidotthia symphoricarpi CBS 119687]